MLMQRQLIFVLLTGQLLVSQAVYSQAITSGAGAYAASAGLGAGLAASSGHGKVVARSYEAMIKTQQAVVAQSQAIEQYMKLGCQFEAAKQWDNAEKSFKYVLQVVARRDGPGSAKGVPALQHLVTVAKAENKLAQAASYQETVLAYAKAANMPDTGAITTAQCNLSNLYVQQGDYASAAPVLKEALILYDSYPSLPRAEWRATRESYAKVLRKLHKDPEADALEATEADAQKLDGEQEAASTAKSALKPNKSNLTKTDAKKNKPTDGEPAMSQKKNPEGGSPPILVGPGISQKSSTEAH
jgi:tetratricopeptide (TPR) repeat protein